MLNDQGDDTGEPQAEAPPIDLAALKARLEAIAALPRAQRTESAIAEDFIDMAARMGASPAFLRLKTTLQALGVKVREWARLVSHRRRELGHDTAEARGAQDERPQILISTDEHDVNGAAVRALGRAAGVYQRYGQLVRLIDSLRRRPGEQDPVATTEIRPLTPPVLRQELSRHVAWRQLREIPETGESRFVSAHPPDWCVKAIHDWEYWPGVKQLYAFSEIPVLLPDGSILSRPGYDERSGLYYQPRVRVPPVPASGTQADAQAAAQRLLALVSNFPFEDDAHRSAWLAALLTPIARWAFSGQSPLFLFDANQSASGKGLLTKCIGQIVVGSPMDLMSPTDNEEEERKRITSKILRGELMVLIDNIDRPFGSATFEALLTSGTWGDRLLGTNDAPKLDTWITWYGTGNNVTFVREDMMRRTCVCRILTTQERPEERKGFDIDDLETYAREHRGELLGAALTMVRLWLMQHRRAADLPGWGGTWGSFDGWDQVVRGAIVFAGLADPIGAKGTRNAPESNEDGVAELVEGLAEAAAAIGKDGEVMTTPIFEALVENEEWRRTDKAISVRFKLLREAISKMLPRLPVGKLPNAKQLGRLFGRVRGRPHKGRRVQARVLDGYTLWRVEDVPVQAVPAEEDIERQGIELEPPPVRPWACAFDECQCATCGRCKGCTARTPAEGGCSC